MSSGPDGGSVYDLAFSPSRPQALYAATAGGVYRSLDGGASWSYSNAGLDETLPAVSLAVDPVHPLTVYAAQNGDVYRSLDGGANWLNVSTSLGILKVVLPARSSGVLYALSGGGIYRTTDVSGIWKLLTRGLPASYRPIDLVADPTDPNRLYALVVGLDSQTYGVFKSVDGGFNWKRSDQGLPPDGALYALAIDPRAPKVLYAGTRDGRVYKSRDGGALWRPFGPALEGFIVDLWVDPAGGVFAETSRSGLFHTDSSGKAWADVSQGLPATGTIHSLIFPSGNARSPLAAVSTYQGVGRGGVFASANGGASWVLRSKGLSALDVTSVAVAPEGLWAVGNEILFKSTDRGETWKRVRFEPVGLTLLVAVAPADPKTVYAVLNTGTLWRSRDSGGTWEEAGDPGVLPSRLVLDPRSASTLYAAGNGIARTTDGGTTWTRVLDGVIYDLELSLTSPSTLYAVVGLANNVHQILRSTDDGSTWVAMPTPENRILVALAVHPQSPETLYATSGGRIYRSTDGGATWSQFSNYFQYPDTLYPLLFPINPLALHVGVWRDNVYRFVDTADPGSLQPLGKSPGHLTFNTLTVDVRDLCRLYAGTQERGLLVFTESGTVRCP